MRRRRQLPSYVRELVLEAGPDSVFWSSVRDPGQRLDVGAGMDQMVNRVIGSSQTATQSDDSLQPSWANNRVTFEQDFLETTHDISAKPAHTSWAIWERDSGSKTRTLIGWIDRNDNDPLVDLVTADDESPIFRVNDQEGDSMNSPNVTIDLTDPVVSAHRLDWEAGTAKLWVYDGSALKTDSSSGTNISQPTDPLFGQIGARGDGAAPLVGSIYELLLVNGYVADEKIVAILNQFAINGGV